VVFGHSLGGEVAVKTASMVPDAFRALVVGDAPLSTRNLATEEPTHRAQNVLWQSLAGRGVDEIVPALKDMAVNVPGQSQPQPAREVFGEDHPWFRQQALSLHHLDPGILAAVLEGPTYMLGDDEPEVLLPLITCPVLLLQADPAHGAVLQDFEVELAVRLLPLATHVRLEAIGHPLHGTHPRQVLDAIKPFLDEL
jgi:pimeloyl-ACP methyl ester carboxylesterase